MCPPMNGEAFALFNFLFLAVWELFVLILSKKKKMYLFLIFILYSNEVPVLTCLYFWTLFLLFL